MPEEISKEKPPMVWMSAREIGIAATFGGLMLATVLLGLLIPVAPGGVSIWALEGLAIPASLAINPIAAYLIMFIPGFGRPFTLWIWVNGPLQTSLPSILYYPIRNMSLKIKLLLTYGIICLAWTLDAFPAAWWFTYFYQWAPPEAYWTVLVEQFVLFEVPLIIYSCIATTITFIVFPKFIKPDWWSRWKENRKARREWERKHQGRA